MKKLIIITLLILTQLWAITYEYDELNRLATATYENGVVYTYSYDDAGNLQSITSKGVKQEKDTDGDGISDKDEENYGLDPLDNSDAIQDIDGDGINNIDEIRYGLNPLDPSDATLDIDGDGVSNIDEIRAGTDLNDNSDYSKGNQESALHSKTDISKLYVAIFNRASEGSGNEYWRNQGSMEEIANTMLNTDDAKEYFGDYLNNNQAFIEWIYKNTLNKDYYQDPDGIGYWTEKLNRGKSKGSVVVTLIDALSDIPHPQTLKKIIKEIC